MAIAFDAGNKGFISGASSLTISLTVGAGSDRALVVMASCINSTDFLASATATWNGTSMGSPVVTPDSGTSNNYVYTWVLVNPASGTHNVVITPSGSAYVKAAVSSWTGVDQTTPISASAKSSSSFGASPFTLSIAASSGVAVDFFCDRAASKSIAPGAGQTQIGSNIAGTMSTSGASYKAGATSVQWTHPDPGTAILAYAVIALAAASASSSFSGAPSLDDVAPSGSFSTAPLSSFTGSVTLDDAAPTGSFSRAPGTITSDPLKTNNGTLIASTALDFVCFYDDSTGALVLRKTGISTDASGVFTVTDALLQQGVTYRVDWQVSTGQRRMPRRAAT